MGKRDTFDDQPIIQWGNETLIWLVYKLLKVFILMKKTILIPLVIVAALLAAGLIWNSRSTTVDTAESTPVEQTQQEIPMSQSPRPAKFKRTMSESELPTLDKGTEVIGTGEINWMTWDEAVAAQAQSPKMLFIDIYTDWCGWCKVMDRKTFTDEKVADYINEHYYAVKFNAESEDPITFRDKEYEVVQGGRRGIHTLAYALLEGNLSYPSYVFLNDNFQRLHISKGFQDAAPFLAEVQAVTTHVQ